MVPGLQVKSRSFDLNTAADKAYIGFPKGAQIVEVYVSGLTTDAGGATVKVDSIVNGESRGDGDLGEITIPASSQFGKALQEDSADGTSLAAGSGCIVQVTAESASSGAYVEVEVRYIELGTYVASATNVAEG